jgi:hypothetical protein
MGKGKGKGTGKGKGKGKPGKAERRAHVACAGQHCAGSWDRNAHNEDMRCISSTSTSGWGLAGVFVFTLYRLSLIDFQRAMETR